MVQRRNTTGQPPLDQFLDIVGHELRNPITALRGQVQLLQRRLKRESGRERDLADLDKVLYQVERLNTEVDIFLAAAHIAERRLQVVPDTADLVAIVTRVAGIYAAGTAGHTISLECAQDAIFGAFDKRRVEQILGVLLQNALKYSPTGEVQVHLEGENGTARVEVLDRGVGVPPAERARIFQRYTHGSNVEHAGAGLGLFVARELVRKHGGRIGVRARPGGGSIFWVELPARLSAVASVSPQVRSQEQGARQDGVGADGAGQGDPSVCQEPLPVLAPGAS
jgi:signal transduction histidine kinase